MTLTLREAEAELQRAEQAWRKTKDLKAVAKAKAVRDEAELRERLEREAAADAAKEREAAEREQRIAVLREKEEAASVYAWLDVLTPEFAALVKLHLQARAVVRSILDRTTEQNDLVTDIENEAAALGIPTRAVRMTEEGARLAMQVRLGQALSALEVSDPELVGPFVAWAAPPAHDNAKAHAWRAMLAIMAEIDAADAAEKEVQK